MPLRATLTALLLVGAVVAAASAAPPGSVNQRGDGWPRDQRDGPDQRPRRQPPARRAPGPRPVHGHRPRVHAATARRPTSPCSRFFVDVRRGQALRLRPPRAQRAARRPRQRHDLRRPARATSCGRTSSRTAPSASATRSPAATGATSSTAGPGATSSRPAPGDDFIKSRYGRGVHRLRPGQRHRLHEPSLPQALHVPRLRAQVDGPSPGQGGLARPRKRSSSSGPDRSRDVERQRRARRPWRRTCARGRSARAGVKSFVMRTFVEAPERHLGALVEAEHLRPVLGLALVVLLLVAHADARLGRA